MATLLSRSSLPRAEDIPEAAPGVPHLVWVFWLGQPMAGPRLNAWHSMQEKMGVPLQLVQGADLHHYERADAPYHPAVPLLSAIHQADYMRAYFMHHYGGGYADVKWQRSWAGAFESFRDTDTWMMAMPSQQGDVACDESNIILDAWCTQLHQNDRTPSED